MKQRKQRQLRKLKQLQNKLKSETLTRYSLMAVPFYLWMFSLVLKSGNLQNGGMRKCQGRL